MNARSIPRKSPWRVVIFLGIGLLVLSSWYLYPGIALKDCSFLTDNPCSVPCWQGIVPGETSRSQAIKILKANPSVRQRSLQEGGSNEWGGITWSWKGRGSGNKIPPRISWNEGIVQEITFGTTCEVAVEQILDKFGAPEGLVVGEKGIQEFWTVWFYYPSIGIQFAAYISDSSDLLKPSTPVQVVHLFVPTSLEQRITDFYNDDLIAAHVTALMRPWLGYGHLFELYYSSPKDLEF